jgi:hypothetical protein
LALSNNNISVEEVREDSDWDALIGDANFDALLVKYK